MSKEPGKRETVLRVLRNRIVRGTYTDKLPGERTLAEELGADRKTVETAMAQLQLLGLVKREGRRGTFVASAGEAPGTAGMLSVRLIFLRSRLYPLNLGSYGQFVYAFEKAAREHRESLSVAYAADAGEAVTTALEYAGVATCVGTCLCAFPLDTRQQVSLAAAASSCVWADWESEETILPTVSFDNYGGGVMLAEKILRLGHRRIAGFVVPARMVNQERRRKGFEETLERVGVRCISVDWAEAPESEIAAMLDSPERPTAIVCRYLDNALRVMEIARKRGLRVPEDVSVATFTRAEATGPVSRVVFDMAEMGKRAFEMLVDEDVARKAKKAVVPVSYRDEGTLGPAPG
jgi:GntR family transcriptional regulator, arabinose operon transcriptional repressor